ncbi:zinc-finger domain-containing protein [Govanella unica]|uniref:Zinc-finger domain-containing protein n=1 Tax=Govanella unica TaxID=2975056 RepID=A0A9X3TVX1_9PROT|nr:zinc-finger domain-containing protein [Govania unica]MDA5192700.1 zinc-finger domain-containing protein [Govania unica]
MIQEAPETVLVSSHAVSCDGGEGALGHPRVYLNLGSDNRVECPYCDRLYLFDASAPKAA